jgi:nucleoside-diphosphate-sugar epimerase
MIIAITGSEGFVGKKLVDNLKSENHQIIELDKSKGIDITNLSDCSSIPYFEVMIHLAAKSYVPESYIYPADFYQINYIGTLNMLELCRKYNSRFIFTSSYVYGNPKYLPIDEKHPLSAFNPYADSKILGEMLCRSYQKFFNVNSIIVRPFNIYGDKQHKNFLISTILEQAKTGTIKLQDSSPKRDYIYIDDVISAFMKIIENTDLENEIFNLGFGESFSVKEITEIINLQYNNNLNIHFSENIRVNEVLDTIANIDNAKSKLNWLPKITIQEGIKRIINGI